MNKVIKIVGIVAVVILILVVIMGFFARRRGVTLRELVRERLTERRASESQELTDTSLTLNAGMTSFKMTSGGITRTGQLYIPSVYDASKATPLVIAYHGGFALGENQEKLTHMSQIADKENFVILYPDGVSRHWNDGRTKEGGARLDTGTVDDVQFTKDMISVVSKRLNIDAKRIYATGISNGGMMAYRVGCELTSTFAAIAPVSSGLPKEYVGKCQPQGTIPLLMMQGTADPLIPFDGGQIQGDRGETLPTRETLAWWINTNRASTTPQTSQLPDADPNDDTTITREYYAPLDASGAPVDFYIINGGGHTWAGGNQYANERLIGKTSRDIDASQLIWDFFKLYSR